MPSNVQVSTEQTSFFLSVSTEREKHIRSSLYFIMAKIPVFMMAHISVDLPLSDSVFFHLFSESVQHDAMTQILTPHYASATLQVYYCHL